MADETKNIEGDFGELRFEFFEKGDDDADKQFTGSVKNLLVLIKDFYGADGTVVYWFNRGKQRFKILAASEDGRIGNYKERFMLGNDYVSSVCLEKKSEIINIDSDKDKELLEHHDRNAQVKSIIAAPLLLDDEVIAVVLCESKTLNFFGTPNIYTLQVFSESITNYIKYYSLNEDFIFGESILGMLAADKLKTEDEVFEIVKAVIDRYIVCENLYISLSKDGLIDVVKTYKADESDTDTGYIGVVGQDTLAFLSFEEKKIAVHDFDKANERVFRFSEKEKMGRNGWFCSLPVVVNEMCIGLISFDTKTNMHLNRKILSKLYKLIYPVFLYLANMNNAENLMYKNDEDGFLDSDTFSARLDAEISRCKLFNENNLYCVHFKVDNMSFLKEEDAAVFDVERMLGEYLKEKLTGYNEIYKLNENKYALIAGVCSEEKVFIEIEKIRKSLSAKIYNIEGKEFNFTASFAIKRFDDMNLGKEEYLNEIENLLSLAESEGGNVVKI